MPAMEIGDCSSSSPLAFRRLVSSLWTRLATRRGFFAARAAASNCSAKARVAVIDVHRGPPSLRARPREGLWR